MLERVTIYRIEHKDQPRKGLYSSLTSGSMFDISGRHPAPESDSALANTWREYCGCYFGFGSVEQLKAWIYNDKWLIDLDAEGYRLAIFEAKGCIGNTQAIFKWQTREEEGTRYKSLLELCAVDQSKGES